MPKALAWSQLIGKNCPGGFSCVFLLFLLLFVSFVPLFRPSWLSRSFCFFLPFPSPFSCRCFSWLCSGLCLFAFLPPAAALPARLPRFALLFCFLLQCLDSSRPFWPDYHVMFWQPPPHLSLLLQRATRAAASRFQQKLVKW